MTNPNINDLSALPAVERLAAYRKQNPSPVWKSTTQKKAPESAIARLNPNNPVDRLTAARMGYDLKPKPKQDTGDIRRGGFVAGVGVVWMMN